MRAERHLEKWDRLTHCTAIFSRATSRSKHGSKHRTCITARALLYAGLRQDTRDAPYDLIRLAKFVPLLLSLVTLFKGHRKWVSASQVLINNDIKKLLNLFLHGQLASVCPLYHKIPSLCLSVLNEEEVLRKKKKKKIYHVWFMGVKAYAGCDGVSVLQQ